jgi:hypothetical protein
MVADREDKSGTGNGTLGVTSVAVFQWALRLLSSFRSPC